MKCYSKNKSLLCGQAFEKPVLLQKQILMFSLNCCSFQVACPNFNDFTPLNYSMTFF